jgi:cobalt transporter subunit CbtB
MSTAASQTRSSAVALAPHRALPIAFALTFGALLIYGTGFLGISAVHNAAHDQRHAIGFPCH